jgi:hypothetical protein
MSYRFTLDKPILTANEESPDMGYEPNMPPDEEVPVDAVPVRHVSVVRRITSEDGFWNYIEQLHWRDRSENAHLDIIGKKQNYRSLSISDQEAFADYLTHVVDALLVRLQHANIFGTLTDVNEQKALCSHVVGKGSVFYAMSMEDPGFVGYLVPENSNQKEYYDLMDFIKI